MTEIDRETEIHMLESGCHMDRGALEGSVLLHFAAFDSNCFEVSLCFAAFDSNCFEGCSCNN